MPVPSCASSYTTNTTNTTNPTSASNASLLLQDLPLSSAFFPPPRLVSPGPIWAPPRPNYIVLTRSCRKAKMTHPRGSMSPATYAPRGGRKKTFAFFRQHAALIFPRRAKEPSRQRQHHPAAALAPYGTAQIARLGSRARPHRPLKAVEEGQLRAWPPIGASRAVHYSAVSQGRGLRQTCFSALPSEISSYWQTR